MSANAMDIGTFDAMSEPAARELLASCCGSRAWIRAMLARRPNGTLEALLAAADEAWWSLTPSDWREAFDHHPRIGERQARAAQAERARNWSASEQRAVADADAEVRAALVEANGIYEARFGHLYLVCASGRSADELLGMLRERMTNDPNTELRVAAGEQAKITRLRLRQLFDTSSSPEAR